MTRSWIFALALGAVGAPAESVAQRPDPAQSVVVIRTDLGGQRGGIGTGFFISNTGRILTAYHVIQGAREVTVSHHGARYSGVTIERISPERDLATLVVTGFKGTTPALPLAFNRAPDVHGEELRVIGHPDGNLYQDMDIKMTTRDYRRSGTVRVRGQKPVFALTDVKVIQFAGIVKSGMSGAPVISSLGVIGMLQGSDAEGGSLAWAIPSEYLNDQTMRVVNKRPSEMASWPRLTLMDNRWNSLRHSIRLDDRLTNLFGAFFEALETQRRAHEEFMAKTEHAHGRVQTMRLLAAERAKTNAAFTEQDSTVLEGLEERLDAMVKSGNAWMDARGHTMSRLVELSSYLEEFVGAFPQTQRNDSIRDAFVRPMKAMERRLIATDSAQSLIRDRFAPLMVALMSTYAQAPETPEGIANALRDLEPVMKGLADNDARFAFGAEVHLMTQLALMIERILAADYDERTDVWRWASGFGYDLTLPGGWEQVGGPEDTELSEAVAGYREQGFQLDRVFGNHIGVADDGSNIVGFMLVGRRLERLPPSAFDSLAREREPEVRAAGLEFQRWEAPDKRAMLAQGASQAKGRPTLRCDAWVLSESRSLLLTLILPPNRHDLLAHCRSVAEGVRFN
jgi:hypothetical protein